MIYFICLILELISLSLITWVLYKISKTRRFKWEQFINKELHKIKSNSNVKILG